MSLPHYSYASPLPSPDCLSLSSESKPSTRSSYTHIISWIQRLIDLLSEFELLLQHSHNAITDHYGLDSQDGVSLRLVCGFKQLREDVHEVGFKGVQGLLVKEDHAVAESALETLLKAVHDVYLHRGGDEDELDFEVAEHVQDLVEQQLLGCLHVVVDVL